MCKTPAKMHRRDMVKMGTIVFEIVGGRGAFKASEGSNIPDRI